NGKSNSGSFNRNNKGKNKNRSNAKKSEDKFVKPRAPWRPKEEFKRLVKERLCTRCGKNGHPGSLCPSFRPARRPSIDISQLEEKLSEDSDSDVEAKSNILSGTVDRDHLLTTCNPLVIDCLINDSFYVKSMIDTGCLCFAVFNKKIVRTHNLTEISISPRPLRLADGKIGAHITKIACIDIDIDGRREKIWGYVMPNLAYPIILGKPWMEKNDVVYLAKRHCLRIGSRKNGIIVRSSGWYEEKAPSEVKKRISQVKSSNAKVASLTSFIKLCQQVTSTSERVIGAITIQDITRALEPKKVQTQDEIRDKLPKQIHQFLDLFLDDDSKTKNSLPPHRPGIDTRINFKKDDQGRDKEIPWGPLYGMSREELLVLRKTLTELLDKNWIRASSSPGGAPVLFIKKPGGGLRFCVDYRALNSITERDRYPLPLIRETLRMVSRAKWLSKVDVRSAFHRLRVAKGDEWKTAFRTRFGSYEWLVTPFGLAGAPAAFQRWINQVLGDLLGVTCAAYLDDVIIFSENNLEDHWVKVNQILTRLNEAGLRLDP
ncbi:hypothetical protein EPUL_005965, partial [Erysiphe pulchra]